MDFDVNVSVLIKEKIEWDKGKLTEEKELLGENEMKTEGWMKVTKEQNKEEGAQK